jgi:glycosyltransferase involved in cell wall biosynthesis
VIKGLVSVVIPTYNRGKLCVKAVESVLTQTYPEVEIIVVDDGSKDDTRALIARTFAGNSKVRYIHKANGGVASARNVGLRDVRGEFVALLDSDDTWLPDKLSLQLECLRIFPEAGMVWSDMAAVDASGNILHERFLRKMYSTYKYYPTPRDLFTSGLKEARIGDLNAYSGDIFSPMVLGSLVHTSTVLLRTERWKRVGFFDESSRVGEDYPFHLKTCAEGPVAFVDTVTIHYTIGAADALTAPNMMLSAATAFLSTFQQTVAAYPGRIKIPPAVLRNRLADAHAWVGAECLGADKISEARGHLLKSLAIDPTRIRLLKPLLESCLPKPVRSGIRAFKRKVFR